MLVVQDEWKDRLERRKFSWINVSLVGAGTSIALLTQTETKNIFLLLALFVFAVLIVFEAIGLRLIETKYATLGRNPWYVRLWFYKSTFYDVLLLVAGMVCLGIGTYFSV